MANDYKQPCDGMAEVKKQLFGFKIGAGVAAFFVSLFFVYVMSCLSGVSETNRSLVVIQAQLAELTKKLDSSVLDQKTAAKQTADIRDRITKLEAKLEK
jgi:hypothetical protein